MVLVVMAAVVAAGLALTACDEGPDETATTAAGPTMGPTTEAVSTTPTVNDDETATKREVGGITPGPTEVPPTPTVTASGPPTGPVTFEFSFDAGQGWEAGFADLPADFDQDLFELDSGRRLLPEGLDANGMYLQGHNRSGDLFMFLKAQVEGLRPNTAYAVTISLDLATNVPAGMMGIGGSPGESVYVKAGASAVEPDVREDEAGDLRMNIDKGNQAAEGKSAINLGNVAHPEVAGEEYRIKTLDNSDRTFEATTDGDGRIWLIVGTDSGFEGLTAIYFARVSFTFTRS